MRRFHRLTLGALVLALSAPVAWAAATATFTFDRSGTFSETLQYDTDTRILSADLSALPGGATIFRAELILKAPEGADRRPLRPTRVYPVGQPDRPLRFVPPRFVGLDALEAVRAAVKARRPVKLRIEVTLSGVERLEVSYLEGRPRSEDIPTVRELRVRHRQGQTFVVFREPKLERFPPLETGADVAAFKRSLEKKHPGIRFRIWRSARPIDKRTIAGARLVGECGLMTGWNDRYWQGDTKKKPPVRYRTEDAGPPLDWGTGIYAHNPAEAGEAYYAVTVAVNGEEDFDNLGPANATRQAVPEHPGGGRPILQWIERPDPKTGWHYRRGNIVRLIYTRWESPPNSSTPGNPIDYLVVIPLDEPLSGSEREPQYRALRRDPAPVGLHLHCWGGSCNGGYGWWYNAHRGAVLIASNQIPYDWWTGYHEAHGTRRTWGDGKVHPFTMRRLFSFLEWAGRQHQDAADSVRRYWPRIDERRVFTAGSSMGGSGAPMYALRAGDRIAWAIAWVGVHVPELSPQFAGSYRRSYGPRDASIVVAGHGVSPWDYFSDVWWLREHVAVDTGFIIASNGKNDGGIGWKQAYLFARALQETRRPHIFNWAMGGHGTRTVVGSNFDLDLRTDQTLPAFTNCSLDDDLGNGEPDQGALEGQYNAYLWWRTDEIVDAEDRWEMIVLLKDTAPEDSSTVDLTPRRCQQFRVEPGDRFAWTNAALHTGRVLASGEVTADKWGLVTVRRLTVSKAGQRVTIERR